jgi:hypothetical protein
MGEFFQLKLDWKNFRELRALAGEAWDGLRNSVYESAKMWDGGFCLPKSVKTSGFLA